MQFRHLLISMILAAILGPASVDAADGTGDGHRRWGVGWDSGIALRHRPSPEWGWGLRFDPRARSDDSENRSTVGVLEDAAEVSEFGLEVGALVYRETRLGRWVALGPYAELGFEYREFGRSSRYVSEYSGKEYLDERDSIERIWHVAIGVRPAFVIEDRFVLETRLGLILSRRDRTEWIVEEVTDESIVETERRRSDRDIWDFDAVGHNLGLGTAMRFIIYF